MERNQVKDQLGSGLREDIRKSQTKQSNSNDIDQNSKNIPKYVYNPQEQNFPKHPLEVTKSLPKSTDQFVKNDNFCIECLFLISNGF